MKTRSTLRLSVASLLGAMFLFGAPDATACGASAWVFDTRQFPECIETSADGVSKYQLTNSCAAALTLTVDACQGGCTVPAEIPVGATDSLVFEEHPDGPRLVDVHWTLGDESDTATFEYVFGACPQPAVGPACPAAFVVSLEACPSTCTPPVPPHRPDSRQMCEAEFTRCDRA